MGGDICMCACVRVFALLIPWCHLKPCGRLPGWQRILCRILAFNFTRSVSSYSNNDNNNHQSVVATEIAAISRIFLGSCKTIPPVSFTFLPILFYLCLSSAQLGSAQRVCLANKFLCLLINVLSAHTFQAFCGICI